MNKKLHKGILLISIISIIMLCLSIFVACKKEECKHEYEHKEYITAPTCTEAGQEKRVCKLCGAETTSRVPALNHDYDEGTRTEPTCTDSGRIVYTCRNNPDHKQEEELLPLGHSYVIVGEPTVPATCESNGRGEAECERCSDKWPDYVIPKLGHDWEVIASTQPDCEHEGVETKVCNNCQDEITETVKPLGHSFTAFEIDKDATSTEEGSRHRNCKRCEYVHTTSIPRIGDETTYTVNLSRVENLPFALLNYFTVSVYDYDDPVGTFAATGMTGSLRNQVSFTLPSTDYIVKLEEGVVPDGFTFNEDGYNVSPSNPNCNIVLDAEPIDGDIPDEYGYETGYVMYDMEFSCYSGKKYRLSDLLKQYKGVMINFYYTTCDPCNSEWPALIRTYNNYSDDIFVILMNTRGESVSAVKAHQQKHSLPFEIMDGQNVKNYFALRGTPTSFYIDCRGVINEKYQSSTGSFDSFFRALINIADKLGHEPVKPGETENLSLSAPQIIAGGRYYSKRNDLLAA